MHAGVRVWYAIRTAVNDACIHGAYHLQPPLPHISLPWLAGSLSDPLQHTCSKYGTSLAMELPLQALVVSPHVRVLGCHCWKYHIFLHCAVSHTL